MVGQPRTELEASGSTHPDVDTWILYFPWPTNPLPMNGSRGGHYAHAKKIRGIKDQVRYSIRSARIPDLGRCEARLTWWVATNGVRDEDNLALLEKTMFDALVAEKVVADDKPALMTKPRGRIIHIDDAAGLVSGRGFTFTVTRIPRDEAA